MKVQELTEMLGGHSSLPLLLNLPSGNTIPAHFHITEVGCVNKQFVDCGGTRRSSITCVLQVWTSKEYDHRLTARNLVNIIHLARPVLHSFELPVEIEYGIEVAANYSIGAVRIERDHIAISLIGKQTDCLAKDKCGLEILGGPTNCC